MKIDGWTIPGSPPGWKAPRLVPRVVVDQTQGGAVTHMNPGAYADAPLELDFLGPTDARKTLLTGRWLTGVADPFVWDTVDAIAFPLTIASLRGISCASFEVIRTGAPTGYISVEVWTNVAGAPGVKVGTLGVIDVAAVTTGPATDEVVVWPEGLAWPLTASGWLVLNGANYTKSPGNELLFVGVGVGAAQCYKYTSGAGWSDSLHQPNFRVWTGSDLLILRGLAEAYCYSGGSGPILRTLTLDDGRRFSCYLVHSESGWTVKPIAATSIGVMSLRLDLLLTAALDDVALP